MAYATPSAGRPVRRPPAPAGRRIRRTRGAVGAGILTAASLAVATVLLTAACVMSASLAARSVLRTGMPTTVAAAIRIDANRDLADRMERSRLVADVHEQDAIAPAWQLASVDPGPTRSCGVPLAQATASADAFVPAPAAGNLATVPAADLAGPPCLTGDDMRATALVLPAAGLQPAPRAAPVLAMAVPGSPDELRAVAAPEHTGSIAPTASLPVAPAPRPRREDLSYPASLAVLDGRTAVYDIVARTVYMPDGTRLEAHSGLGAKRDDPRFVHVRMHGATPPNVYDLRMREALFHGVRAIRMTPVDRGKMFGRDGMLAHTYMLGPNGQSNGCVSFRNYEAFLQAFLKGEVKRMVVVARLLAPPTRAMLRGVRGDQIALNSE